MKTFLIIIAFFNLSMVCKAQCQEKIEGVQLQKGMLMYTNPNIMLGDSRTFVAEIISVNGFEFTCRFLHSNSVYYFKNLKLAGGFSDTLMQATVVKSKGGSFQEGHLFDFNIYMKDPEQCNLSTATEKTPLMTVVTFLADNKSYLANVSKIKTGYLLGFLHSKSIYEVDENFKVTKVTGGGYAVGSKIKIEHARLLVF